MQPSVLENRLDKPTGPFEKASYGSRMLKQYVGFLAKRVNSEILDIGPVCGKNIEFFLGHAAKLHVHDVMTQTHSGNQATQWPAALLEELAYENNSLDGIHVWDLHDHISNHDLSSVVQKLWSLLKPHGVVVMIASNVSGLQPFPQYFKIGEELTVTLQKSMVRRLPYYYRTNRAIEKAMQPLVQICSAICTNGVREFLFRRQR